MSIMGSLTEMADAQVREAPRGRRREGGEAADHEIVDAPRTARVDDQEIETETGTVIEIAIEIDATGKDGTVVVGVPRSHGGHLDLEESKSLKPTNRVAGKTLEV